MSLFPLFLKLDGEICLVVGGGSVGLEKIESLLRCGASVCLVSPQGAPGVKKLSDAGKIEWRERCFMPEDLMGARLVIAATNDREVNRNVFEEASRRSILSNVVDDPPLCDFFCASIVERGSLQVAISTAGKSPAFAQRLRREIDSQLAPDLGPWLNDLGDLRREVLAAMPAGDARKDLLHQLASREPWVAAKLPIPKTSEGNSWYRDGPGAVREDSRLSIPQKGRVYLVGAGPGDPDLLTLRAAILLAEADVILHDDLVPPSILSLAGEHALLMSVGKRCGQKKITQAAIHDWMISSARRNLAVVRLKSGDPLIFGRAGEEMDALRAAQVPFEVVPGVTAVSSAAALLETSLTDRRLASKLIIFSGHHAAGETPDQGLSPALFADDTTVAIYMPGKNLCELAAALLRKGVSENLPCVAVNAASQPEARYQACRLSGLARMVLPEGPHLLLMGRSFESVLAGNAPEAAASLNRVMELRGAFPLE